MNDKIYEMYESRPRTWLRNLAIAVLLLVLLYLSAVGVDYKGLHAGGAKIAVNIFKGVFTPDQKLLFSFTKQGVPFLLLETLSIALLGTLIGAVLAVPLAFLAARNVTPRIVNTIIMVLIAAMRTFPAFVYGLMFIRVTGPGAFAGVLTLSVTSIGMTAKLYIEAIEDLDRGILESLDAAGCSTIEKIRHGIIPQLFSNFLSTTIYRFEINVKNASILGLVGAGGIGAPLLFAMSAYRWTEVGAILFGLIVLVLIIENASSYLRNKLARGE